MTARRPPDGQEDRPPTPGGGARQRRTLDWLRIGRKDLRAATRMLKDGGYDPYQVCFFAQQAAEKSIKAALTFEAREFEPTHDLDTLTGLLPSTWKVHGVSGRLRQLTSYGVETRYPAPQALPTVDDADRAVEQATAIHRSIVRDLETRGMVLTAVPRQGKRTDTAVPPT